MSIVSILIWVILGVSVFLFLLGFFFRVSIWLNGEFTVSGNIAKQENSKTRKFLYYSKVFLKAFFSRNFFKIIISFILDGIIHINLFKDSKLKWFIHIFMFWGLLCFTIISVLHVISVAIAQGWLQAGSSFAFVRIFGSLENKFTAVVLDISKIAIFFGAFLAVVRFLFLKKRYKSVELKDKSAGILISLIGVFGFLYEASYFATMDTPMGVKAFAPGGFILSYPFEMIRIKWWMFVNTFYPWIIVGVLFFIYITGLLLFIAFIPYGKYSHMVFGPFVAVYNKWVSSRKSKSVR
jgi:heterodisulfide reductase subunit E